MTAPHDLDKQLNAFLREGPTELPDPSFDMVRDRTEQARQRVVLGPWRVPDMNKIVGFGLAAAAVVTAVLIGSQLLASPPNVGGPGLEPTASPTSVTLASGSFTAPLGDELAIDIEATGREDDVSGTMQASNQLGDEFTLDLQCARTAENGLITIAGRVTDSTNESVLEDTYVAILFAPGTPVRTILWFDVLPSDVAPSPADSCPAFLAATFSAPEFVELTADDLVPIEGDLEFGP